MVSENIDYYNVGGRTPMKALTLLSERSSRSKCLKLVTRRTGAFRVDARDIHTYTFKGSTIDVGNTRSGYAVEIWGMKLRGRKVAAQELRRLGLTLMEVTA